MAVATIGIETDGDARAEEMARTPESAELCPDRGLTETLYALVTPISSTSQSGQDFIGAFKKQSTSHHNEQSLPIPNIVESHPLVLQTLVSRADHAG